MIDAQLLHPQWTHLTANYESSGTFSEELFRELTTHYSQQGRVYHNLDHIAELLFLAKEYHNHLENPDAILFAIWFHDAIYDPLKGDNEAQSAAYAEQAMQKLGVPVPLIQKTKRAILATANHLAPENTNDPDIALFLDFDLKILGAPVEQYEIYSQQIRQEYHQVPDNLFYSGRKKILDKFVQSPFIYHTTVFQGIYEEQARHNVEAEILELNA